MVDRYWRKIESIENDIENSMQISSILLKLKEHDEKLIDLSKIGDNENNISSNLSKIGNNESNISNNFKKINNIGNDITVKIKKDINKKTFIIPNMPTNYNSKNIADIYLISNFTTDRIIKIDANYNYCYDKTNDFSHVYKFYNSNKKFKEVRLNHNKVLNVVNDKFDIQGINSTKINLLIYLVNNNKDNKSIELFDYNTVQVIYNDNIDILKSDTNESNIASNLEIINTNKTDISSNLEIINTNKTDISSNLEIINTNKSDISNNLEIITTNKSDISNNLEIINTNKSDISSNLNQINDIKSILPTLEIFKKTYSIKNQSFKFNSIKIFFKLLEIEIENNFNVDGKLEIDSDIYYKYDNLQKDHHRLQHEYRIFDDKNNLLHKTILNKRNSTDLDFNNNIMLVKDNFYITFKNNYNKIKIILDLYRVYRHGTGVLNLNLIDESFTNIAYLDKNDISLKIEKNKNDISTNLININTNEDNIAYNLEEINYIKKISLLYI